MKGKKKEMKFHNALITIVIMIIAMFYAVVKLGVDPQIPLVFGCMVAGIMAAIVGYNWEEILEGALDGISKSLEAVLILMLIGILVGTWIASGTVPTMIYYGLNIVSAQFFPLTTMVICAIVAFAIGSWGTVGTIGIAFMGIGLALEIPAPLVAGSIISGAYLGEVISPLSDATNLAAAVVGEDVFKAIRKMVVPATITLIIAGVIYFITGLQYGGGDSGQISASIAPLLVNIKEAMNINVITLLPMIIMVICILLKVPAIPSMLAGIISGMIIAASVQGVAMKELLEYAANGYVSTSGNEMLDVLLTSGGMLKMMDTISIIIVAMAFGGIMQHTKQMEALTAPIVKRLRHDGSVKALTGVSCIAMNLLLADQYLGISVPGQMYEEEFEKRNIDRASLAQVLLGTGAVTSPLIPWNTCGMYVFTILGVSPLSYGRYAYLCLILPVVVIVLGFFGKKVSVVHTKVES